MKKYTTIVCAFLCLWAILMSCSSEIKITGNLDILPTIYPDYQGVTLPPNIAPLDFEVQSDESGDWALQVITSEKSYTIHADNRLFTFDMKLWKELLSNNRGKELTLILCLKNDGQWKSCRPFTMNVAEEPIDPYLAYRLIPPGYSLWKDMGIYQRNLETFEETAVYKNREGMGNCVNCHSFRERNPGQMLLHMRSELPGTYIFMDGKKEKLDTKTDHTLSPLVYPYWHPSGDYVAFSVNKTFQVLHTRNQNRIEVCDEASDVLVYDINKHEVITTDLLSSDDMYETFPTFSPDGKFLYFCSALAVDSMPQQFREIKYSLCRIPFDANNCSFGQSVDTLYNAQELGRSVSFPRVSPDGKLLVFTLSDYGNFSIWHKDADLYCVQLENGKIEPMEALNSDDVESYHSWSSNSRWMVFSSRRENGLYTQPYIAYVSEDGISYKPLLLPQRNPKTFYEAQQNAYNIPELVSGKIPYDSRDFSDFAHEATAVQIK